MKSGGAAKVEQQKRIKASGHHQRSGGQLARQALLEEACEGWRRAKNEDGMAGRQTGWNAFCVAGSVSKRRVAGRQRRFARKALGICGGAISAWEEDIEKNQHTKTTLLCNMPRAKKCNGDGYIS